MQGLLLPRDRNKTLTGLADAEPITGAQHREVQRLQWFLSESAWDHEVVNNRRVQLLCQDPATAPHEAGVLVLDDTGDRKDGTATAHVARQYLGSVGKIDNGIVAVTSLWADERVYWPVHAVPYTPASRLPGGDRDPGFKTKPQLAVELVQAAREAGIEFQAVVADCFDGDNPGFTDALVAAGVPFVLALKPARAPGRRRRRPTPRPRQPPNSAGAAPVGLANGGASSAASATATARRGGRPTPSLAAGARSGGCGWWSRPPTRHGCRATAAGIC
jgi:SRSO17 transposase